MADLVFVAALLLGFHLQWTRAAPGWDQNVPFQKEVSPVGGVEFLQTSPTQTVITMLEGMQDSAGIGAGIPIAIMNYEGDVAPDITGFDESKSNETLGAISVKDEFGVWHLVITKPQDFEDLTQRGYRFYYNIGSESAPVPHRVGIAILDVNDNSPIIKLEEQTCEIDENAFDAASEKCHIELYDADSDGLLSDVEYVITDSVVGEHLFKVDFVEEIDKNKGRAVLSIKSPGLDFETFSLHILTIRAIDTNDNEEDTPLVVIVKVNDLPDQAPIWKTIFSTENLKEQEEKSFQVLATDGDIIIDADILYELHFLDMLPEHQPYFSIGSETGLITVKPINRDVLKTEVFKFNVTAYEKDDLPSRISSTVIIIVEDINNNSPTFTPEGVLTTTIKEGSAVQLELNITVYDPDLGEGGQFSIKLEDPSGHNWNEFFMIIPANGYQTTAVVISVTNPSALDFENLEMRDITLKIVATEKMDSNHIGRKDVMVKLEDVNDEFPIFAKNAYTAVVPENAKMGDYVITILATDKDQEDNGEVIHTLTSGQQMLKIDPLSGSITVAQDYVFDFEMQAQVIVQVMAEDLVNHKSYVQLTIIVDDINDTPPVLEMPIDPPSITEDSSVGTVIQNANIRASDRDGNAELTFSIDWDLNKSFATKQGARVANTSLYMGCIEVITNYDNGSDHSIATATLQVKKSILEWLFFDTLSLLIVVTDSNTVVPEFEAKKQATAILTIKIEDVNNYAPKFTQESLNAVRRVLELSAEDQLIGGVIAIDLDGPGFNDITYSLEEADLSWPPGLVKINPISGELLVDKNEGIVLKGVNKTLKYTVIALDNFDLKGKAQIEIVVIDTNNNPPVITSTDDSIIRPENTASGDLLTTITYSDDDVIEAYRTASFFLHPDSLKLGNWFSVDEVSGELRVNLVNGAILDRDPPNGEDTYEIKIILRDNVNQGNSAPSLDATATIRLTLTDVNDNAPKFRVVPGCLASPMENTTQGSIIFTDIYAEDVDEGVNGTVIYTYESYDSESRSKEGLPPQLFDIETVGDRARIRVLENLSGFWGVYNLHLKAQDSPVDINNQSTTHHSYQICVLDINDNPPVFIFPENGKTIRLREDQTVGNDLIDANNKTLKLVEASDADDQDNGLVTFSLGTGEASDFFEIDNNINQPNKAKLKLKKALDVPSRIFKVTINAEDHGTPPMSASITITVMFVAEGNAPPVFDPRNVETSFPENERGVSQNPFPLPLATDLDNEGSELEIIYYHMIGATGNTATGAVDASGVFNLHKTTNNLSLAEEVDREVTPSFTLTVLATNNEDPPDNAVINPASPSQLTVTVVIEDENDTPPEFEREVFSGGIATGDKNGMVVLTLRANDPDEDDAVTYEMFGQVNVSHQSLENIKNKAFSLGDGISGDLTLLFDPNDQMSGYFEFQVRAIDKVGVGDDHIGIAGVKVFVISESNRVTFRFRNDIETVEENKFDMTDIFSDVINFNCTIDSVVSAVDEDGVRVENQTDVVTHFIDSTKNEAVEASKVTEIVSNRETMNELQARFWELRLDLFDYNQGGNSVTDSIEGLLQIVLIVVSVVLGTLVIILFAAFFLKTRSLNRRLEALSTTKFGSQDSGLNRVGMAVPNTNKHAVEGSNPVWNEDIAARDFDNISEGSDDSDLIGIEDRPEFETTRTAEDPWSSQGTINGGYQPDAPRRVSLNPLSLAGVNPDNHHVDIDSPVEDDFGSPEHSNFSFGKPLSTPTTEL